MASAPPEGTFSLGVAALDRALHGGLARGALHEIYAVRSADQPAAAGFAAALAQRAANRRPILWVRQDLADIEAGRVHPPGLVEFGLDPQDLVLVQARDVLEVLKAGAEAARCPALGAVLIEPWGEARRLDLTASRRLHLAAQCSGVTVFVLRAAAKPASSAAATRWAVSALLSQALAADAPGFPAFRVELLRHRSGVPPQEWRVEWNRDRKCFQPAGSAAPVSLPVVSVSAGGPAEAGARRRGAG